MQDAESRDGRLQKRQQQRGAIVREEAEQLAAINNALTAFLLTGSWQEAFGGLLKSVLSRTQSEYGFVGVIAPGPTLRILAHEGLIWDAIVGRDFYEEMIRTYRRQGYLEFTDFKNLFGQVVTSGKVVLSNDPGTDPRSGGLPPGHPPLLSFLGAPLLQEKDVIGLIGVANRPGGYELRQQHQIEHLRYALGLLCDSYRRQERQKLLEERLRISDHLASIGTLAAGVAHEINNPLAAMLAAAEVALAAKDDADGLEMCEQSLRSIVSQAKRGRRIVRDLLHFAKDEDTSATEHELNEIVQTAAKHIRKIAREKDIAIDLELFPDPLPLSVRVTQIEQAVINLLQNAIDASRAGSRIRIRTARHNEAHVITVTDEGMGIESQHLGRVFDPFFTTRSPAGTGLGLTLVHKIISHHGGSVDIQSQCREGTTVRVELPLSPGLESAGEKRG